MVVHTQFSRHATSADKKKLWDPSEILGIINTDPGYQCITCVGYAPSQRRRCRIALRKDNRDLIEETLDDIAYLSPDSSAVISRLREIAGPALCVRYHQGQAETIVMQWKRKIQQLKPKIEERKPTSSARCSKKQESAQNQKVEDLQDELREMRELLAKLREEINGQRHEGQGSERREEQIAKDKEERKRRRREEIDREARRLEKERVEKERLKKERLKKERLEKERLEKENKEREEKIRRKREKQEGQKEREEWDQCWTKYQERWVDFRASATREGDLRDAIPWPVKSGSYSHVNASNVREFLQRAVPSDANMAKLMRKECQRWHPDTIHCWLRGSQLSDVEDIMIGMICRVVTDFLNSSAGRSDEFLG